MLMLLFSVLEIKQEYFHKKRYSTIRSVRYITTILPIVCICAFTVLFSKPTKNKPKRYLVSQEMDGPLNLLIVVLQTEIFVNFVFKISCPTLPLSHICSQRITLR